MPYEKTVWKNRLVERPKTFRQQQNVDGTVTLIPEEGQIYETGTPVNAEKLNKIEDAIQQAFQSASDGKTAVASAITAKGVTASPSDTFPTLATKIGQINTGKKWASGSKLSDTSGLVVVTGLSFRPSYVMLFNGLNSSVYNKDKSSTSYFFVRDDGTASLNSSGGLAITDSSFSLYGPRANLTYNWIAFE